MLKQIIKIRYNIKKEINMKIKWREKGKKKWKVQIIKAERWKGYEIWKWHQQLLNIYKTFEEKNI